MTRKIPREEAEIRKVREFVNHDDLEYGDRPVANAASELIRKPDRILVGIHCQML